MEVIERRIRSLTAARALDDRRGQATATQLVLWKHVGYSVLLFLLLLEWLVPLRQASHVIDLEQIQPLVWSMGFSLVIGLGVKRTWLASLLRGVFTILLTMWVFGSIDVRNINGGALETMNAGLASLVTAITSDASMLYNAVTGGGWDTPSGEIRTIVLLGAVSILASLVQSLLLHHQSILWFSSLTMAYLFVLQGAASVDTSMGIVRTIAWSAALLSWLYLERITLKDHSYARRAWPLRWWFTTMLVTWGLVAGFMLWQQVYAWESPQAWNTVASWVRQTGLHSTSASQASLQQAVTGYGSDDSELGANVKDDHRVLFQATTPMPTYWKVETKSLYTGRGWEEPAAKPELLDRAGRLTPALPSDQEGAWSEPFIQTIQLKEPLSKEMPLLFGGRPERITSWSQEGTPSLWYDPDLDRYRAVAHEGDSSSVLSYSYETRAWLKLPLQTVASGIDREAASPELELSRYLALPASIPARVYELADEITINASSQQEKIEQIQAYLRNHYAYTKQETSIPQQGSDFVDHFLFEQRQGYCNHFSSAMVVLLRAEGIPARWVKGFAPGEADASGNYIIRASDAHSWVEVYEASAGWVPYEATPPRALTVEAGRDEMMLARSDVRSTITSDLAASPVEREPMPVKPVEQTEKANTWEQVEAWINGVKSRITQGGDWLSQTQASIRTSLTNEWNYVTERASWTSPVNAVSASSSPSFLAKLQAAASGMWEHARAITTVVLLLVLGLFMLLLHRLGRSVARAWPRWELRKLVRRQQHHYDANRLPRMGVLAWLLLERQFGARPLNTSFEEYVEVVVQPKLASEADSQEIELVDKLRLFASDSSAQLFARHKGERVQRGRFIQCCSDIVRLDRTKRLPQVSHGERSAGTRSTHTSGRSHLKG